MHTALHFQQGGQIIVQKRNTRCLCSPSGIIIQVRPGKSTKICSNKRSCFTPTMDTVRTNIETKTMPKKNIFRDHSKSMRNHNITTSAISCKPEGISQFLQSLCLYNRDIFSVSKFTKALVIDQAACYYAVFSVIIRVEKYMNICHEFSSNLRRCCFCWVEGSAILFLLILVGSFWTRLYTHVV